MIIVKSVNRVPIRLTQERWSYITRRHPEIKEQREKVLETLKEPNFIQKGDFGELLAIRHYKNTPLTTKFLAVVYKEMKGDGFIITAYFTNKPSTRRKEIWKQ